MVDASGTKAITILPSGNRLKADVLPCHTYKRYDNLREEAEGIAFWNRKTLEQIINFPKQHIRNGEAKNDYYRTQGRYKTSVRMFKNARESIISGNDSLRQKFPSYFVECLIYNVPDNCFRYSFSDTYIQAVNYLVDAFANGTADKFETQSGLHWLLGSGSVQWSKANAQEFVSSLNSLWSKFN